MPSGAKKRKIAKKKKGLRASSNNPDSSVHSQGIDDLQHCDDKGSDSGSPASEEHRDSEHPLPEGDEKEVEKSKGGSSGQLAASEQSSQEVRVSSGENATTEENIVQIDWELNSEEDYGSKEGSIESKEVHTGSSGSSSNSSRSSSDDEARVEKKTEVVPTGHAVDAFWEVASQVDTCISAGENSNGVRETASVVSPEKATVIEDAVQTDKLSFGDDSAKPVDDLLEIQEVGYKLEAQEIAEKKLPSSDNSTGVPPVSMDLGLRKGDEKAVSTTEEKPTVPADVNNSAMEDKDAKLLLSFNAPTVHASKDADDIKASDRPECSKSQLDFSQPLVASAPQTMQKTSLKSCCGIFELFTSPDK